MNKLFLTGLVIGTLGHSFSAQSEGVYDALFHQAEYWQELNRSDLAKEALEKVLLSEPSNREAIYRMGLIAAKEGDDAALKKWSARLSDIAPSDPRSKELNLTPVARLIDPAALSEARRLSGLGHYELSVAMYEELLGGDKPSQGLAVEYYLTLAGTPNGLERAKRELKKLHQGRPNSLEFRLAYAKVLTYDESSRREGIERLAVLAANSEDAKASWRQALLWLNVRASDKVLYEAYQALNADDTAVMEYYQTTLAKSSAAELTSRTLGYRALNANRLSQAQSYFNKATVENKNDAEALAGLGLIALRQQHFAEAKVQLGRAMAMAPAKATSWRGAYQSADFYTRMAKVREWMAAAQPQQALSEAMPLTKFPAPMDAEAQVVVGQLQQTLGLYSQAKQSFEEALAKQPHLTEAKFGLIALAQSQGHWDDAERLTSKLSESERSKSSGLAQAEVQRLRREAANSADLLAEVNLRRALKLSPDDPWVRLDLARLLKEQGEEGRARALVDPLQTSESSESRYVAALFASEQQRWREVDNLMSSIPKDQQTPEMRELAAQSVGRSKLQAVLKQAATGNHQQAQQQLIDVYQSSAMTPVAVGNAATDLLKSGQPSLAAELIELDLGRGAQGPAAQYVNHVIVLNETGRAREAKILLFDLLYRSDLHPKDKAIYENLQRGLAIREADELRELGQLASAYDILASHLRESPEDEEVLLAMARLYQAGRKSGEAEQLYEYVLRLKPTSQAAISGAAEMALQKKDASKAEKLLARLDWTQTTEPKLYVLAARVAQAQGRHDEARDYLVKARSEIYQNQSVWGNTGTLASTNPFRSPAETAPNPFKDKRSKVAARISRPTWLPGQIALQAEPEVSAATEAAFRLTDEIDSLLVRLDQQTKTRVETDMVLRVRQGSDGSSRLAAVEAPVSISTGVFGNHRVSANFTPVTLTAGQADSEEKINQFGRGALVNATSGLAARFEGLSYVFQEIRSLGLQYEAAKKESDLAATLQNMTPLELARLQNLTDAAKLRFENASKMSLLSELGLSSKNLNGDQWALINKFIRENYTAGTEPALDASSVAAFDVSVARLQALLASAQSELMSMALSQGNPHSQSASGLALSLGYQTDWAKVDIGSTPLGFEKTNLVGGITIEPEVSEGTRVVLHGERRAVKDSFLSYAGAVDHVTGEMWGAVTKTGGGVGMTFDNGLAGAYGNLAFYNYDGEKVASNKSHLAELGAYFKPPMSAGNELQLGVHVNYTSFDQNLSKFTFGHGGYFSPEDYVSVAFPINYRRDTEAWTYSVLLAPGFQSYTEAGNALFPTDARAQAALSLLYALDAFDRSGYASSSKSGFGLTLGANAEYRPTSQLKFGGQLSFDSFGDYNESVFRLYMKYLIGGFND